MADNILAKDGNDADVTLATKEIAGAHYDKVMPADPTTGVPFKAADDATLAALAAKVPVLDEAAMPVMLRAKPGAYWPGYGSPEGTTARPLLVDPNGAAITRGSVLTDEGTFRLNFANTSLAVGLGSVTVSGRTVTGTGFATSDAHYKDYFKLAADADTAWTQIESIDSDTQMTLVANYVGGSSGTGQRAIMRPVIGTGGSVTVASGQATIASGTTTGAITGVVRFTDYAPLVFRARASISQRIANQTTFIGLREDATTARWFARFRVDGTTATTVICETGRNPTAAPSAAETESTTITLPFGLTTATLLDYWVELLTEAVRFYVNGVRVADHVRVLPHQHDEMASVLEVVNATSPASNTNIVVDYVTGKNHNKLEVGVMSDSEQIVAAAAPMVPFAYSVAGVIAINTDLIVLDCRQLRSLMIQCRSMGTTGVVTVQWANEPTFAAPITATLLSEAGAASTTFNAAVLRYTNVIAAYCRLRLTTATTAGTTTIEVWGSQTPIPPVVTTQAVSGTVGVTGYPTAAASADALANPTVTKIDATSLLFNGATWDRQRNNHNIAVEASSAKTATGNGATQTNFNASGALVWINVSAVSGTTPTLTVRLQWSPDGGTTWVDLDTTNAQTASITATGQFVLRVFPGIATAANAALNSPLPRTWRLAWTIGGTTPSFTFAAQASYIN